METKKKEKKKNSGSKLFLLAVIIVIILIIVIAIRVNKSEEVAVADEDENTVSYVEEIEAGVKLNTSTELNEIRTVDGLEFSNIQLTSTSGKTDFLADVKNVSGSATELKSATIILYDENGDEMQSLTAVIKALEPDETVQIQSGSTANYVNAYDLEIVFN